MGFCISIGNMTQHHLNKWTRGKGQILNGEMYIVYQREKEITIATLLDLMTRRHFLFLNTQDNFKSSRFYSGSFHSRTLLHSLCISEHLSFSIISSLSKRITARYHRHFSTSLRKIEQRFRNGAIQSYFLL